MTGGEFAGLLAPAGTVAGAAASEDVVRDLALDQIAARLRERAGDEIAAVFLHPLHDAGAVRYRQAVFLALEDRSVRALLGDLAGAVGAALETARRAAASPHPIRGARLHLSAVRRYTTAVRDFVDRALQVEAALGASVALADLLAHVRDVVAAAAFLHLEHESGRLEAEWESLRYITWLRGSRVTLARFDDEPDLSAEIDAAFDRFKQGDDAADRSVRREPRFDIVQAAILDGVGQLFPELFTDLGTFQAATVAFADPAVLRFARELRFFLAYLDIVQPVRDAGLPVCIPALSESAAFTAEGVFDLAMALRLVAAGSPVVGNDIALIGTERILVVTGPNQGGKSTTARAIGQLHHLAAVGCPVPGRAVRLTLPDVVLTQFDREEQLESLESRLETEVRRMRDLLDVATGRSVIVLNEVFASTALEDARRLTREVIRRIGELDALCVCVTFADDVAGASAKTVSLVGVIDPDDPAARTFRLERRAPDGMAYALALAAKHGLTFDAIVARVADRRRP